MPPPMMTQRAAWGSGEPGSGVTEASPCNLEPLEVLYSVARIVEVEGRVQLRDHAPHRFAHERGTTHCRRPPAEIGGERGLEIGLEQPVPLVGSELVVRGQSAQIEERAVVAGILPIDEPEALAGGDG